MSAIKKQIESELNSGKIQPNQAEILKQREPIKQHLEQFSEKKQETAKKTNSNE